MKLYYWVGYMKSKSKWKVPAWDYIEADNKHEAKEQIRKEYGYYPSNLIEQISLDISKVKPL
jgi:hypothetical protein